MSGWGVALVVALVAGAAGEATPVAAVTDARGERTVPRGAAAIEERGEAAMDRGGVVRGVGAGDAPDGARVVRGVGAGDEPDGARVVRGVGAGDERDGARVVRGVGAGDELDGARAVRQVAARVADKAALYGDPALVPTRAGERARQELAIAAAVAAAIAARDGGAPVVEVRLPAGADGGAVVVAGEVEAAAEEVVRIAEAVAGPWSVGRVAVFVRSPRAGALAAAGRPGSAGLDWRLVVALVGFGASAGIAVERLRRGRRGAGREVRLGGEPV